MRHSSAKLSQVVIRVQISPAHPIVDCHFPEDRMGQAWVWQVIAEPAESREQRGEILTEINRGSTSFPLLHLRPRGKSRAPLYRHLQGAPLQHRSLYETCRRACSLLPQRNLVGVHQMAHHLVDRHGAPTRVILRRKPRHSKRYVLPFGEILQGLHICQRHSRGNCGSFTACGKTRVSEGYGLQAVRQRFQKIRL